MSLKDSVMTEEDQRIWLSLMDYQRKDSLVAGRMHLYAVIETEGEWDDFCRMEEAVRVRANAQRVVRQIQLRDSPRQQL